MENGGDAEWRWAHLLWQRHGLRMEDFAAMPRKIQLAYMASELVAESHPVRADDLLLRAFTKPKK